MKRKLEKNRQTRRKRVDPVLLEELHQLLLLLLRVVLVLLVQLLDLRLVLLHVQHARDLLVRQRHEQ